MIHKKGLLIITTSFPQRGDGSEAAGSFVADLAIALASEIPVRVVAPGAADTVELSSHNIKVFRYSSPDKPLSSLRPWWPRESLSILMTLRAGMRATLSATADGGVSYCLALWALPSGFWANELRRKRAIPYSAWMLGSDVWSLGRIPFVRRVLANAMRQAEHRFADGRQLAEQSQDICGLPVEFLPSTRSTKNHREKPLAAQPPYRLLFLGRWHPNKGPDLLLEALSLLKDSDWARIAHVGIFGGGAMADCVYTGAERLAACGRPISVGGYLDKDSAECAMLDADYLIIPSRIESIPVVFSDALKLRCPVVSTPVGDLAYIVNDWKVGFCADSVSATALCAALQKALMVSPKAFERALDEAATRFSLQDTVCSRILSLIPTV